MATPEKNTPAPSRASEQLKFSNIADRDGASSAISIILFDLVNTPPSDQLYARKQLLKFLEALPPGQQVALFILTDHLYMIQNFTSSSDELAQAARLLNPQDFNLIQSKSATVQELDMFAGSAKAGGAAHLRHDGQRCSPRGRSSVHRRPNRYHARRSRRTGSRNQWISRQEKPPLARGELSSDDGRANAHREV